MGEHEVSRSARAAVFLDRDGVLNRAIVRGGKPHPPSSVAELRIEPLAVQSVRRLRSAGFVLVGITNQPDVARGAADRRSVEEINTAILAAMPLEDILVCYHDDSDRCACRKPEPGLVLDAAERYDLDLKASFLIGDRWKDVEAGRRAGCRTVFLDFAYEERRPDPPADFTAGSISEAADWIFAAAGNTGGRS
jgi:D-glycero-D-manno-heptose 1,7-bisphosphate phosphatase